MCYELTWVSGDASFGCEYMSQTQYVIYALVEGSPVTIYRNRTNNEEIERKPVSFKIENQVPALVCISLSNRTFTLIQNENQTVSNFPSSFQPNSVRVDLLPGSSGSKIDRVSVNFGSSPFSNSIPDGYNYFSSPKLCMTQCNLRIMKSYLFYVAIMLLKL